MKNFPQKAFFSRIHLMYKDILVIIPAYNEEKTIVRVIKDLQRIGFENILVIDDGSDDRTGVVVQKEKVILLTHAVNLGKGAALKTGFEYTLKHNFRYLITSDADGQHSAKDVQEIANTIQHQNVEIVLGSRFINTKFHKKTPLSRRIYNKIANMITFITEGIKVSDSQCGLRGYTIKTVAAMNLKSRGLEVDSEILGEVRKHKLQFTEVPITPIYTKYSLSKGQSFLKGLETFYGLLIKEF